VGGARAPSQRLHRVQIEDRRVDTTGRIGPDENITSMDTTSPIHWSWSSTCFQTVGKYLLATVVTVSYGFQFGCSTTP
jgi:hypothetical protein